MSLPAPGKREELREEAKPNPAVQLSCTISSPLPAAREQRTRVGPTHPRTGEGEGQEAEKKVPQWASPFPQARPGRFAMAVPLPALPLARVIVEPSVLMV